jgi:hypothetical protein
LVPLLLVPVLQVASEDTVLYTARRYCSELEDEEQQEHARGQLARQIRCPHLSHFWLSGSVNSAKADEMLLAELRPQIRRLLLLRAAQSDYPVKDADLREGGRLAGAPPSWGLWRRVIQPLGSVQLVWQVEISKLRDAARRSAAEQEDVDVDSPPSPPLGGISFGLQLCDFEEGVALYVGAKNLPDDMFYLGTFEVQVEDSEEFARHSENQVECGWNGWPDVFGLGVMAGGWDEVAWAGTGLPSSGHLTIKLKVSELSHVQVPLEPVGRIRQ